MRCNHDMPGGYREGSNSVVRLVEVISKSFPCKRFWIASYLPKDSMEVTVFRKSVFGPRNWGKEQETKHLTSIPKYSRHEFTTDDFPRFEWRTVNIQCHRKWRFSICLLTILAENWLTCQGFSCFCSTTSWKYFNIILIRLPNSFHISAKLPFNATQSGVLSALQNESLVNK
jgi:hypothetical protein